MKKDTSSKVLNFVVIVGIVLTVLALITTPLIITAYVKSELGVTGTNIPTVLSVGIYISAIPYVISLILLKKLCSLVGKNEPFSKDIPRYLKQISLCAFSEILIFNIVILIEKVFFDVYLYGLTVIPGVVVSFISLTAGLLFLVLSRLFEMAIKIKEENAFTI